MNKEQVRTDHIARRSLPAWRWQTLCLLLLALLGLAGSGCSRAVKQARHMSRADKYFRAQNYQNARIEYMQVLRLSPTNAVALRQLGLVYYEQGQAPNAYHLLTNAIRWEPENLEARLKLGTTALELFDRKRARLEAEYVLSRQPTNGEALLLLVNAAANTNELAAVGRELAKLRPQAGKLAGYEAACGELYLRQRELQKAGDCLTQALASDPKNAAAYSLMGSLCLLTNGVKQADQFFKTGAELSPMRSPQRLRYADFKIQTGEVQAGKALLDEIIGKAPDYVPALNRRADFALVERDYDKSNALLTRVLAQDPFNYGALALRARLRLAKGDSARAVAELQEMARYYPSNAQVAYQLGVAQLANTNTASAFDSLRRSAALNANFAEPVLLLAQLNLRRGDAASAIQSLTDLVRRQPQLIQAHLMLAEAYQSQRELDRAIAVYRGLSQMLPKSAQPHYQMGLLWRAQKKPAEARQEFETAQKLAPTDLKILAELVSLDVADKQFAAALQRLQGPLKESPQAPEPRVLLAAVQLAQGNTNLAIATLQKTMELVPKALEPRSLLAAIQLAQGNTNQAISTLEKIVEMAPESRGVYLQLAGLYVRTGRKAEALTKLQAVLAKNPKDLSALLLSAGIREQTKDYAAARQDYERILAVQPQFALALNNLAYLCGEHLNDLGKAHEYALRARELAPKDPYCADTLGWILYRRGEYTSALTLLKSSAAELPEQAEISYHLGMAYYMLGDEASARAALDHALKTKGDFSARSEAAEYLSFLNRQSGKSSSEVVAALTQRLERQPGDPVALARLAPLLKKEGKTSQLIHYYEAGVKVNPTSLPLLLELAQLYGATPQGSNRAIELAKAARNLGSDDGRVAHLLGKLIYPTDQKWGLALLQESAQKLPKDPELLYDLGVAQYGNGQISQAEATVKLALQADPSWVNADQAKRFLALSSLYMNPAKAAASASVIQATLAEQPDNLAALMATGIVQEQARNYPAAKESFDRILVRWPSFSPAARQRALLWLQSPGDEQRVYDWANKARAAFPQDAEVARALGYLCYQRGEYARTVQLLKERVRSRQTNAEDFFYLGMAQFQMRANVESAQALRQSLALNLKAPLAEEAKQVLARLK